MNPWLAGIVGAALALAYAASDLPLPAPLDVPRARIRGSFLGLAQQGVKLAAQAKIRGQLPRALHHAGDAAAMAFAADLDGGDLLALAKTALGP